MSLMGFTLGLLLAVAAIAAIAAWWTSGDRVAIIATTIGAVVVFAAVWVEQYVKNYAHDHVATCHITGTDGGGGNGSYRVYTKDCGTLSNHDTWLRGKTKSADVQGQIVARLTEPHTNPVIFTMEIAGVRFGPASKMPNIIKIVSTN